MPYRSTMDTGQSVFADTRRHIHLLEKFKAVALLEEETALANAQKKLEISTSTELSLKALTSRSQGKHTILEDEYQQKRAALEREYEEKKAGLDDALEQQLNEIKAADEDQKSCLQDEKSILRRRSARALQRKVAKKEWMCLLSRMEVSSLRAPSGSGKLGTTFQVNADEVLRLLAFLPRISKILRRS